MSLYSKGLEQNKMIEENKTEMNEELLDGSVAEAIAEDDSAPEEINAQQIVCECGCKRVQLILIERDLISRDCSLKLLCLNCGTLFPFEITQDHLVSDPKLNLDRSYLG